MLQQIELDHSMQHCTHTSHAALPSTLHNTADPISFRHACVVWHLPFQAIAQSAGHLYAVLHCVPITSLLV